MSVDVCVGSGLGQAQAREEGHVGCGLEVKDSGVDCQGGTLLQTFGMGSVAHRIGRSTGKGPHQTLASSSPPIRGVLQHRRQARAASPPATAR